MKAKLFNPLPAFALDLALAMMKAEVRKRVIAKPAITPRSPDDVLVLRRKLGVTEFPPKLTVLVRGQRWFDPSGRELDQKIYREYYHCPDAHTPRFGRIAGSFNASLGI
jgi:hypothetical protein